MCLPLGEGVLPGVELTADLVSPVQEFLILGGPFIDISGEHSVIGQD
jgi:hypothetical protein